MYERCLCSVFGNDRWPFVILLTDFHSRLVPSLLSSCAVLWASRIQQPKTHGHWFSDLGHQIITKLQYTLQNGQSIFKSIAMWQIKFGKILEPLFIQQLKFSGLHQGLINIVARYSKPVIFIFRPPNNYEMIMNLLGAPLNFSIHWLIESNKIKKALVGTHKYLFVHIVII